MTKTFVATVVLQLVEERRISLDDPITRLLPGLVTPNAAQIKVKHLLQHTSGVFDHSDDPRTWEPFAADEQYVWSPDALIALSADNAPYFAPGTGWRYSNTNYVILGRLVERVTGRSLREELERRIIRPLRLKETYFPDGITQFHGRYVHGYLPAGTDLIDTSNWSTSWAGAAGSLVSTPGNLAEFYRSLAGGKLINSRSFRRMLDTSGSHGSSYGLGIGSVQLSCGAAYGHEGSVPGYWSLAYSNPAGTKQVVLSVNHSVNNVTPDQAGRVSAALDIAFCRS